MRILIIISSCGTLLNQSLTKTAFAVTLLKLTRGFSTWKICHGILWFCIVSMCGFNFAKVCISESPMELKPRGLTNASPDRCRMGPSLQQQRL